MQLPLDLDPSADQARQWLSDELARSEYHDTRSLFQRLMDWVVQRLSDLQATQGTGGVSLPPIVITVAIVLLVLAAAYLLTRVRVESRAVPERSTLLGDTAQTAEELRRQAQQAFAAGRHSDAVLAWIRAMARDAERRTLLPDAPSMTAHEVGAALATVFPTDASMVSRTIDLFDQVAYGGLEATRDDAAQARSTDDVLASARPVLPPASRGRPDNDGHDEPSSAPTAGQESGTSSVWMTGVRS